MQASMKTNGLSIHKIEEFLKRATVGRLVTISEDGYPYAIPVHFVYSEGMIYIHGLPKGKKIDNISINSKVCFEADEMGGLIYDDETEPCDVNTEFRSVIVTGNAVLLSEVEEKKKILKAIVEKYTPSLSEKHMPEAMLQGTGIIKITPNELTGKSYNGE